MTDSTVVIQYDYPGTTNGRPVGTVYVERVQWGEGVFSHTYDPEQATKFSPEEAAREISIRYWPRARPVPLNEAKSLA